MSKEITISEREKKCLEYLAEIYPSEESNCTFFRVIAREVKLPENKVRIAVRSLARKGLAEYVKGLIDYDGMICGSGYCATLKGALIINSCSDCKTRLVDMNDGRCEFCYDKNKLLDNKNTNET